MISTAPSTKPGGVESGYAWIRLTAALLIGTIGGVGTWSVPVALPAFQADFAATRGDATLPYTLVTLGFAFGGVFMGRLADRRGITIPVAIAAVALAAGYILSGLATSLWQLAILHGVLIGFLGTSATFAPLMADISHWFTRRRGIAVAIAASGSYAAGAVWPPILQYFISSAGWRATHIGVGLFCLVTLLPLSLILRRPVPAHSLEPIPAARPAPAAAQSMTVSSPALVQALLVIAALACCVAMAMPQVHIVAYCADLGYGVARGAEMLSIMLALGVVSRIASGWLADRIGGVKTLLLGSALQALTLLLYMLFDGLASLYLVSALFGLVQGGIVPSYAIIIREYFAPAEAGTRVGVVIMANLVGMALGGWVSGVIFDLTGSYQAAFAHGLAWNLLNLTIALWLLMRPGRRLAVA